MNWTTKTTYVDIETGEKLTKEHAHKKYDTLTRTIKYETNGNTYGIKHITWACERKRQQTIWE